MQLEHTELEELLKEAIRILEKPRVTRDERVYARGILRRVVYITTPKGSQLPLDAHPEA